MDVKVVKIGGNVVDNPELLKAFVRDFAALSGHKVLVHGGGVLASTLQKALGQTPKMIEGRRVTDEDALRVVTMVYAGWCNKSVVALLQAEGCNAIGLSGADGDAVRAVRRPAEPIDYGFVGDISASGVNVELLRSLMENGMVPVLCAITHDGEGSLLNTNADTIASSVASALAGEDEVELIYCFEKDGVLADKDDDSSVIPVITPSSYAELKASGAVADGMIPKLDNAFKAIASGVGSVAVKHARNLLSELQTTLRAQ